MGAVALFTRFEILLVTIIYPKMGELFMKHTYTLIALLGLAVVAIAEVSAAAQTSTADFVQEIQEKAPRHDVMMRMLASGLNPNMTINGCPLIIYVTMKLVRKKTVDEAQWYAMLSTILKMRAHVDELDTNLHTALMYASYYGHDQAVKLLLNHQAQAGFCNDRGESPISKAHDGYNSAFTETQKKRYKEIIALLTTHAGTFKRSRG
jgi:ankyrin repeat protein